MSRNDASLFRPRERLMLLCAGIAFVAFAALLALGAELDTRERAFRMEAYNVSLQLSRQLAEARTTMVALHGFYRSGDDLHEARFPPIARSFTEAHPQVAWLAYADYLRAGEEARFEARMEEAGYIGLRVRPVLAAQPRASGTTDHLPVSLLEPLTPRLARLLGMDVLSLPRWRERIQKAIDMASVTAARVDRAELGGAGFLLVRPTYLGNVEPGDIDSRRRQLAGLLMLFLDTDTLLAQVSSSVGELRIEPRTGPVAALGRIDEVRITGLEFGAYSWPPRLAIDVDLDLAGESVPFLVSSVLRPAPLMPLAAALLAGLFAASVVHGMRQRRIALREERAGFEQAQLAEVTLHSIGEAVLRLDDHGRVRYANPVAETMAGVSAREAEGRALEEVLRLSGGRGEQVTLSMLGGPAVCAAPLTVRMGDGSRHAVACTLSSLEDSRGQDSGHVLVVRDVSREQELSQELAHQASHDPLTELPNRRAFARRLVEAIESARSRGRTHVLLYLDLDQFKLVNDTCGHAAGDQMLRQMAGLLAAEMRDGDLLARLGGDEFGVLLGGCDLEQATPIAERLCRVVAGFRFAWGASVFGLGASIGVVAIDASAGTVDELQSAADLACYAAKDMGRNRVHVYRRGDAVISRNHDQMQWQVEVRNALEEQRFVLHAQEIRRLHEVPGPPVMYEFLLRMEAGNGSLVPPMAFLPAAERYGLMEVLDRMVVERAFEHVAAASETQAVYTINLSGQSLAEASLGNFIIDAALRTGAAPGRVCFEITETSAISNLHQAVQLMHRLRREGFRFALDDFGAGLSSFGYLKQLPLDFLKIDGQFTRDIDTDPVARVMVSSIINVARVLGLRTIAEKVETAEAQRCLRVLGVDYAQGWLIGHPAPVESRMLLASGS